MDQRIERHVREIERCNQRGGRMLTVRDLLDAGTLDEEIAAYFLAAISGGRSFLVGANPGGAGKTTVMAALLNFIPDIEIVPVEDSGVIAEGLKAATPSVSLPTRSDMDDGLPTYGVGTYLTSSNSPGTMWSSATSTPTTSVMSWHQQGYMKAI